MKIYPFAALLRALLLIVLCMTLTGIQNSVTAQAAPTIYYVNWQAKGANTGKSWADAFTDLQSALAAAQPGDQIWVAQGIYYPTGDNDRSKSFDLSGLEAIYGGFTGNETSLDQRNWLINQTILSGDIGVLGDKSDNS